MPWRVLEKHADAGSTDIYRAVIEGAPTMLWLGDATGKCVFLNRRLREFWGVSIEEIPSFDWTRSIHPDDLEQLAGPFRDAMENLTEMEVEARYRRADGVYRILRTSAQPRFGATGEFLGMVGVNTDVTEQRESEKKLNQAMESLTLATNASRLGWGTWNMTAGTAEWDARGRKILGLDRNETTSAAWCQRIHPEDRSAVCREIESCIEGDRSFDIVYRVRHRDGSVLRVHGTGSLRKTADGVIGTGLVRDVTEQAREVEFHHLVIRELGHRIKNLLGLVNSLVSQTRTTGDAADYKATLQGRLDALAASVGVVAYGSSDSFDLQELSKAVLRPYLLDRPDVIRIAGPHCNLPERYGRIVGLALHELTTNAVKYGALSSPQGHVELRWDVESDAEGTRLRVGWAETGGPPVEPPSARGFGSRLLEDIISMETGARSEITFDPRGVRYTLDLQIEQPSAVPERQEA